MIYLLFLFTSLHRWQGVEVSFSSWTQEKITDVIVLIDWLIIVITYSVLRWYRTLLSYCYIKTHMLSALCYIQALRWIGTWHRCYCALLLCYLFIFSFSVLGLWAKSYPKYVRSCRNIGKSAHAPSQLTRKSHSEQRCWTRHSAHPFFMKGEMAAPGTYHDIYVDLKCPVNHYHQPYYILYWNTKFIMLAIYI